MACVTKELTGKNFFLLYRHLNLITSRLMMLLMKCFLLIYFSFIYFTLWHYCRQKPSYCRIIVDNNPVIDGRNPAITIFGAQAQLSA